MKDSASAAYVSVMNETNGQMASINETMLESKVAAFKKQVQDAKLSLQKMTRDGEPEEDIEKEKEYLATAETQLSNVEKRLGSTQARNEEKFADGEEQPNWETYRLNIANDR